MNVGHIFKIINLVLIWIGIGLAFTGMQQMNNSNYTAPSTPMGWTIGMFWIGLGAMVGVSWATYVCALLLEQQIVGKRRWTISQMASSLLVLMGAVSLAVMGTYLTWKHPYRLGPCDCGLNEWGPQCVPCACSGHGLCDSGSRGSGRCACDLGWGGDDCSVCDDRWKPEGVCDTCRRGFAGEKCDTCDRGYDGDNCDVCASGWRPWQHSSDLFPQTIDEDDRHICDECRPHHWGYECKQCPIGRDVPFITLTRNDPITIGTRARDHHQKSGAVYRMQVDGITTDVYEPDDTDVLQKTRVKLKYDEDNTVSEWFTLEQLGGFECNNRGTCRDDVWQQENNPDWQESCTYETFEACTVNSDCTESENCKGTCQGTEIPIPNVWRVRFENTLCSTDADCNDPTLFVAEGETYGGGQCVDRTCCRESFHGDGTCACKEEYFGNLETSSAPLHELSPGCDFCPGYDWQDGLTSTICSGGEKGTCDADFDRNQNYVQMKCSCAADVPYIDPDTKIVFPNIRIDWSGAMCECGKTNPGGPCDFCAPGYWGPQCKPCPGGAGFHKACGGGNKGTCSEGPQGDGTCTCNVDPRTSSWMLTPYIKKYASETVYTNAYGGSETCEECYPNFFGPQCLRCDDTDEIKSSELDDIFQPPGSYQFLNGSSDTPQPVCHRGVCSLACGGGGWCNWGRQGDGQCKCWSNRRETPATWNPLDNVCIGNDRYDGTGEFNGTQEMCPSWGFCPGGSRSNFEACGFTTFTGDKKDMTVTDPLWVPPRDDWDQKGTPTSCTDSQEICRPWQPIDWTPNFISCRPD